METLTLRPFAEADIPLFTTWLHKDYILKWYKDPASWLEEINGREGTYSWIHHFIVMRGGTPMGFCQYYDCYDANQMEDWYQVDKPGEVFSIDYLIGEEACLHKGYGKEIVALLIKIIQQIATATQIIVQPEKENTASNHVLQANGFCYDEAKEYYCLHVKHIGSD